MLEAYRLTHKDECSRHRRRDGSGLPKRERWGAQPLEGLLERIRVRPLPCAAGPSEHTFPKRMAQKGCSAFPTFEDKVAQRAVTIVLEAIYERDFLPCSCGFRPGQSAHQALRTLQNVLWAKRLYWVLDIDIRRNKLEFVFALSPARAFLDQRVTDGVIRRMIDKWLKAGAVEDDLLHHATEALRKGGIISPCLSNIFLHHVLDEWFRDRGETACLEGECTLVRFADDAFNMRSTTSSDAPKRVLSVLGKRLSHGMDLPSTPTRRAASSTSAQRGCGVRAIRKRMGPASTSWA